MDQSELQELILPAIPAGVYIAGATAAPVVARIVSSPTFPHTVNNVATNAQKAWRWIKK